MKWMLIYSIWSIPPNHERQSHYWSSWTHPPFTKIRKSRALGAFNCSPPVKGWKTNAANAATKLWSIIFSGRFTLSMVQCQKYQQPVVITIRKAVSRYFITFIILFAFHISIVEYLFSRHSNCNRLIGIAARDLYGIVTCKSLSVF